MIPSICMCGGVGDAVWIVGERILSVERVCVRERSFSIPRGLFLDVYPALDDRVDSLSERCLVPEILGYEVSCVRFLILWRHYLFAIAELPETVIALYEIVYSGDTVGLVVDYFLSFDRERREVAIPICCPYAVGYA